MIIILYNFDVLVICPGQAIYLSFTGPKIKFSWPAAGAMQVPNNSGETAQTSEKSYSVATKLDLS